jgi:hypothetical protein
MIITIIIISALNMMRFFVTEETISLKIVGFEKLNLTFIDFVIFFLKLSQLAIYCVESGDDVNKYLVLLIALLISVLIIMNLFTHLP